MIFYTIINGNDEFVVPTFKQESEVPKFEATKTPCLFSLLYDTVDKVKQFYWVYYGLNWEGLRMCKIKIELIKE